MAEWPISITEAAERLDIPFATASILIRTHDIPTIRIGTSKGLDRKAFERLRPRAAPFRRQPVAMASSA